MVKEPGLSDTRVISLTAHRSASGGRLSVAALWVAVLIILVLWPAVFAEKFYIHIATLVLLYSIGASSFHLILRTGQLSMGHAAFLGLGAYASVLTVMKLHWPYPLALLLRSEVGRAFDAVREGDSLAESTGVPVLRTKVLAFVIAAAMIGMQGSLAAHYIRYISPLSYTFGESLMFVVINVVGGINTLAGAVIGTVFLVPLPEFLRSMVEYQWVLYGVILVVIMAFAPGGIVGVWNDVRRRYGRRPRGEQG